MFYKKTSNLVLVTASLHATAWSPSSFLSGGLVGGKKSGDPSVLFSFPLDFGDIDEMVVMACWNKVLWSFPTSTTSDPTLTKGM